MSKGRHEKTERAVHKRRRIKLIEVQDRRCAVCGIEMDTRDAMYEIDIGPGLIAHRGCFFLYCHAKKYKGPILNEIFRLVNDEYEECNDDNTT